MEYSIRRLLVSTPFPTSWRRNTFFSLSKHFPCVGVIFDRSAFLRTQFINFIQAMIDLRKFGRFQCNLFSRTQTKSIPEVYIEQNFEYIFNGSEQNFMFRKACYRTYKSKSERSLILKLSEQRLKIPQIPPYNGERKILLALTRYLPSE